MRLRTVILILAGLLVLDLFVILGVWIWKRSTPVPVAVQPGIVTVNETSPAGESESPMPQPAPTARFDSAPFSIPPSTSNATIESPQDGQAVPRRFPVSGTCGPIPAGHRLMLVIDSGRGVYSPKFPLPDVEGGSWSGTANDFGAPAGGNISLCVFLVSDEGVRQLTQWQAQGKATGKYPPFRQGVPGSVELKRIKLTIARN